MTNDEIKMLLTNRLEKKASEQEDRFKAYAEVMKENPEYANIANYELLPNLGYSTVSGVTTGLGLGDMFVRGSNSYNTLLTGIGGGIFAGTQLIPLLMARLSARRTEQEQKAYEKSTLSKIMNFLPGVGAYNTAKSKEYYKALVDEKLKNKA